MSEVIDWYAYEPCPTCFRTYSCIAVADARAFPTTAPTFQDSRRRRWAKGWTELKRPHPTRRLRTVPTERLFD